MKNRVYIQSKGIYRGIKKRINHLKNSLTDFLPKLIIVVYHRVLPEIEDNLLNNVVSLRTFVKQIDTLVRKYPIISLSDAIEQIKTGDIRDKIQVVFTFDDGYRDNYEIVFPILRQKGLAATFFLVTEYVDSSRPLWDWEIIKMLSNNNTIDRVKIGEQIIFKKKRESGQSFAFRIFDYMKSVRPEAREEVIESLKNQLKNRLASDYQNNGFITWEQAKKMSQAGMEIGAHSISHRSLSRIPFEDAIHEIKRSKEIIEKNIGKTCLHFAFPFGSQKDYNQALIDCVKNSGFQTCLLNIHGYNHVKKGNFCFKRIIMDESTDLRYLLG